MENASKALIIAGAILLAILIIGIAMFIYNSASDTLDKTISRMSEQERLTFNQRFQKYEGTKCSGTDVKSLINELVQNYSTQVTSGEMARSPRVEFIHKVTGTTSPIVVPHNTEINQQFNDMLSVIKTTRTYNVKVNMNAEGGIVNQIVITEND